MMSMLLRRYHPDAAESEKKPVEPEKPVEEPKKSEEQAATEVKHRGRRKAEEKDK